ncbi:MAG: hypothetical protein ACPGVG_00700 [Mycobacterium sp.]
MTSDEAGSTRLDHSATVPKGPIYLLGLIAGLQLLDQWFDTTVAVSALIIALMGFATLFVMDAAGTVERFTRGTSTAGHRGAAYATSNEAK